MSTFEQVSGLFTEMKERSVEISRIRKASEFVRRINEVYNINASVVLEENYSTYNAGVDEDEVIRLGKGILDLCDESLYFVLAHECGHIINGDTNISNHSYYLLNRYQQEMLADKKAIEILTKFNINREKACQFFFECQAREARIIDPQGWQLIWVKRHLEVLCPSFNLDNFEKDWQRYTHPPVEERIEILLNWSE